MEVESLQLEDAAKTVSESTANIFLGGGGCGRKDETPAESCATETRGHNPTFERKKCICGKLSRKKRGGEGKKKTRQYIFGIQTVTAVHVVFPKDEKVFICAKLEQNVYLSYLICCGCCTALCNSVVYKMGDSIAVIGPSSRGIWASSTSYRSAFLAESWRGPRKGMEATSVSASGWKEGGLPSP